MTDTPEESKHSFLSVRGSPLFLYRLVVGAIVISTSLGLVYAVGNRASFVGGFPGAAVPGMYAAFLIIGSFNLVALVGLLLWRRWAVLLYGTVTIASVVVDVVARAPVLHQVAVVGGATAVFLLAHLNRDRFRRNRKGRESDNT